MKKICLVFLLILAGCTSSTAKTVTVHKDSIPSLYSVLGDKKITGTHKSVENGVYVLTLTYKSDAITLDELYQYAEALRTEGYLVTKGTEENDTRVIWQLGTNSVTDNNVVLINFIYSKPSTVIIEYISGEGTITPN